jgi:hypothetical protein
MIRDEQVRAELRTELRRIVDRLGRLVAAQRGRPVVSHGPLRGLAIEEGEAEGLLRELAASLTRAPTSPPGFPASNREDADPGRRADESPLLRARLCNALSFHPTVGQVCP